MRTARFTLARLLTAAACLLALAGPAAAQKPKVKITSAQVGLPPGGPGAERDANGRPVHVARFGSWAPVYVDLEVVEAVTEPAELVVEAPDADEVATTLTIPLPALAAARPGQALRPADLGMMPYTRPAAGTRDIVITVRTTKGVPLAEPVRIPTFRVRDPRTYVVLSLNGPLPGFELPKPAAGVQGEGNAAGPLREGRIDLGTITSVDDLPDQWFGYDTADLVVLNTGSEEFVRRLFGEQASAADKARRAGLLEWVRRGGRIVVPVGLNAGLVAQLPALQELLPATIPVANPGKVENPLVLFWTSREGTPLSGALRVANGVPVATLAPRAGRPGRVMIPPPDRQAESKDRFAVQSPLGLGRVTALAFDLDRPPFTDFDKRAEFYDWVLREGGAARASAGPQGKANPTPEDEDAKAAELRTHTETFDGVPVVSFGWVAVLIVLYILLIGPVEYVFLKRVLGRLELTWVTFPVIVLTVSAAAYFTAYAVKGRDLKVNKVDVVEVDPASGRVFGTSWFTVFSPRAENYTIGLTPAEGWTADPEVPGGTLVGWVGNPRPGGRPGWLRRRYEYHVEPGRVADGLIDVPVQVWATKSFSAAWSGRMDPAAPVVETHLYHPPGDPNAVIGRFTSRMPFEEVRDCVAFYAGQAYPLPLGGTIVRGQEVQLVLDRPIPAGKWVQDNAEGRQKNADAPAAAVGSAVAPVLGILFHEASLRNEETEFPRNASVRRLDQSWRLSPYNRDEVILVGRVLPPPGPAEEVIGGPDSPTRLWLRELPGTRPRTPIPGTARQETFVRVYLPVRPAGSDR
jgi:hypothetical protein